jgi:GntR family transcriptional regulator
VARVLRSGSLLSKGETLRVTSAGLVIPPRYVADLFDLDPDDQVVRREWVTGKGSTRTMLQVTWYPAHFAASVPELLSESRASTTGHDRLLARIEETTGRRASDGRDDIHGREADEREAGLLALRTGSPILAGTHRLWDSQGVVEYGEWCLPYRMVIGYEYRLGE